MYINKILTIQFNTKCRKHRANDYDEAKDELERVMIMIYYFCQHHHAPLQ